MVPATPQVGHDNATSRPAKGMDTLHQALRGAQHSPARPALALLPAVPLLVVGAGGALGSAVLAEALVAGRFLRVLALVAEPVASAVRGFEPLPLHSLQKNAPLPTPAAVIVLERARHSNGRDDAFVQPDAADLLPLARALHQRGVRRLLVVVPHAPALLPQALAQGLASLDEAAVAALGFEHLVLLRAAQTLRSSGQGSLLQRFASWWLQQLSWMVPPRQQPLRAAALARCVVELARGLPALPPGTRVIAPEQLWHWTQTAGGLHAALARGLPTNPSP